jgi:6-phosphofructo-2-kinase/fructose-2,6-biphosphatase 2
VFNVGNYRRHGAPQPTADFFDTGNAEGERMRRAACEAALADMFKWFNNGGVVGILDATNSTKERRKWVLDVLTAKGIEVIFVESWCEDEALIMANIRDVKTTSPDYKGQDPEDAALDFRNRIRNYEKVYKTLNTDGDEDHLTYLKIMNVGKQVIINRIQDYLQSRVVYYLMNLHIRPRSVWLSRVSLGVLPHRRLPKRANWLTANSTASLCLTWKAASAAMLNYPTAVKNMPANFPSSCANQLV